MRILIATDAWRPQINGVVRTYEKLKEASPKLGIDVDFLTPARFRTVPCPTYPEIRLALVRQKDAGRAIAAFAPDYIHVATEGPIGLATRGWCLKAGRPFTTSYHTRFPEYVAARFPIPESWGYALERWFHNAGIGVMVATPSLLEELRGKGLKRLLPWSRGVDTEFFHPRPARIFGDGPVFLYVGRVSVEKNLEAFLALDLPGRKVVVGGGPQREALQRAYPQAIFTGPLTGESLAEAYASADVFVFPSRTDTYGVVLLEALASGVPIAGFPVTGPLDIVSRANVGSLNENLSKAAMQALTVDRQACRDYALSLSWEKCARQFLDNIITANAAAAERAHAG
jgi:glycosyltransferase involved in cell wall biosynthesis